MSVVTAWSPFFQSRMRMRGRAYQLAGRVTRLSPIEDDELVRAQVQGRELYTVIIRKEGRAAQAECTCPCFSEGTYCKHIWATLLDIQHRSDAPGASWQELSGLRVRAPKARKRDELDRPSRNTEPEWVSRLSLLRPPTIDLENRTAELLPPQRQIGYVLLPEASQRHGGLVLELRQRTPIASGWSKLKVARIAPDTIHTLTDPQDRELCALILGASRIDEYALTDSLRGERSHGRFRLPPAARRTLLQRMVATGRCFIDLNEEEGGSEVRLRWNDGSTTGDLPMPPAEWVLWMVGQMDGDDLMVRVELRRNHRKMPIDEPLLVLGGNEGLIVWTDKDAATGGGCFAAPFDDRGASRWVQQFRGERRDGSPAHTLRVPREDIERFLDRLYMLPHLPEIDLPDHLNRDEQHLKPVPHLELFSPQSVHAVALGGASALKQQLLAKVWFVYGDQRVNPLQAGRFVTVSGENGPAVASAQAMAEVNGEASAQPANDTDLAESNGHSDPDADQVTLEDGEAGGDDLDDTFAGGEVVPAAPEPTTGKLIRRDHRAEREAFALLASLGLRQASSSSVEALLLPIKHMGTAVSELITRGWVVSADQLALRRPGSPAFSVSSGIDWFELRGGITYERADGQKQEVSLPEILTALRNGENMITLGDGSRGLLPEQWLEEHGLLTSLGKIQGDHLRFRSSQAALLDALLDQAAAEVRYDDAFARLREKLHEFQGVTPLEASADFKGTLRPYQREGLGWLRFLRVFGVGGILADDMGLGKTIQVLATLQARKQGLHDDGLPEGEANKRPQAPSLIVAPRSLVFNWIDEAQKFTPELRCVAYTGVERDAIRGNFEQLDVVVTSYGLLRRDIEQLKDHRFDYVVLDEAQAIKNPNSQAAKAARLLQANHRLALTGTPVENHLGDLWSIFEFLNPGMLGSSTRFGELVRASTAPGSIDAPASDNGEGDGDDTAAAVERSTTIRQVARALRPFILRRTKKQVLQDLPEKTEQTIVCEMEPAQRQVYDDLRKYYRGALLGQVDGGDASGSGGQGATIAGRPAFMVLEALLRLRQAACHPGLIDDGRIDDPSAKLEALIEMLGDVTSEGGKALVFSQFTSMLSIVRRKLEAQGVPYVYLDGQTRDRRKVVEQFQNDPTIPVFLISLKAGGFGLNLTAAEYVFILDPWWNPAVEQQAIDRAHRIGQTQHVFAYRMICQDTVEQRIIELQNRKRLLADAIVDGDNDILRSLTRDDLEQLLS